MPPNINSSTSITDHENMESSFKVSDTTPTSSSTDSDSVVTRTPSPPCDVINSRQEQVIMEEFNELSSNPPRRAMSETRRAMSETTPTPSMRNLLARKKSSSRLLSSFTSSKSGNSAAEDDDDTNSDEDSEQSNSNIGSSTAVASRWVPTSRTKNSKKKVSTLFRNSFSRKKQGFTSAANNHSSHPARLSNLVEEENNNEDEFRRNSDHHTALTDLITSNRGEGPMSTADVGRMLLAKSDNPSIPPPVGRMDRGSTTLSSFSTVDDDVENELDHQLNQYDSQSMMDNLGDDPSSRDLDNVAAVRAKEYIEECLSANVSVLDREKWESIPQFTKMDLVVGQHLGKGSFSDAFEVFATIVEEDVSVMVEAWKSDRADLDRLIDAKFKEKKDIDTNWGSIREESGEDMDNEIDAMFGKKEESGEDMDNQIDAMFGKKEESGDDMDNQIDAMFGKKGESGDSLDNQIDAMFGKKEESGDDMDKQEVEKPKEFQPKIVQSRRPNRRRPTDLSGSVCLGSQARTSSQKRKERKVVLAMKCLRPQIRSNAEQFMIGVEDLVHETAMLASLDHPNIVKIHGRAGGGCVSNSFRLSDGFFILLDRLKDTLEERIGRWKKQTSDKKAPPSQSQIKTARSIADAVSYLHSKKIVFRDLKPANVGFDNMGVLKLFDFGFAIGIDESPRTPSMCSSNSGKDQESHLLYEKCGTPRYMAPEVGLSLGYHLPADVYSFGILLWEICALKKPFGSVKSADEFHNTVFVKGDRPKVGKHWPAVLRDLITTCWDVDETERPTMPHVKSMLAAHAKEIQQNGGKDNLRKSSVFRRFTS